MLPNHTHRAPQRGEGDKPVRLTKQERIARQKVFRYMAEESLSHDHVLDFHLRDEVPDAWHTLEYDLDVTEPQVKITLRLDRSVATFYRGMGKGYQARINRILALWAHMKIGRFLELEKKMEEMMGR